jgi:hypothetical protein
MDPADAAARGGAGGLTLVSPARAGDDADQPAGAWIGGGISIEGDGSPGVASGAPDELGLGFGVVAGFGVGVGLGLGAGLQPPTPLPLTEAEEGLGNPKSADGSDPSVGNSLAASARIPGTSGIWIEPRTSNPEDTSG